VDTGEPEDTSAPLPVEPTPPELLIEAFANHDDGPVPALMFAPTWFGPPGPGLEPPPDRFWVRDPYGGATNLVFRTESFETTGPGGWAFRARRVDDLLDTFVLTNVGGTLSGYLETERRRWAVRVVEGELTLLPQGDPDLTDEPLANSDIPESDATCPPQDTPEATPEGVGYVVIPPDHNNAVVIDLLVVYSQDSFGASNDPNTPGRESFFSAAEITAAAVTGASYIDAAFATNNIPLGVRVLAVAELPGWVHNLDMRETLAQLADPDDGVADAAWEIREQVGADIVVGLIRHGSGTSRKPPITATTPAESLNPEAVPFFSEALGRNWAPTLVLRAQRDFVECALRHEFGHVLGAGHSWDEVDDLSTPDPGGTCYVDLDSACGYAVRAGTQCAANSGPPGCPVDPNEPVACFDVEPFKDIMAYGTEPTMNFYSDASLLHGEQLSNPPACGDRVGVPGGSLMEHPATHKKADIATMFRNWGPFIAGYRDPVMTGGAATITSHPEHTPLPPGVQTLDWERPPGADAYRLEFFRDGGERYLTSPLLGPMELYAVDLPAEALWVIRLWTRTASLTGMTWSWTERRLSSGVAPCGAELPGVVPPQVQHTTASCTHLTTAGAYTYCQRTALGALRCDVEGPGNGPTSSTLLGLAEHDGPWTAAYFGTGQNNLPFCCLMADPRHEVTSFSLIGSEATDLVDVNLLEGWSSPPGGIITVQLMGGADGATLRNHDAITLISKGGRGVDTQFGLDGPQVIVGGKENDISSGGDGPDIVVADYGVDSVGGGGGVDYLCSATMGSVLQGANLGETDAVNVLYYLPGLAGLPPAGTSAGALVSSCNRTADYGTWGGCTHHTMAAPPTACAPYLP
jgi:hypothetical protein